MLPIWKHELLSIIKFSDYFQELCCISTSISGIAILPQLNNTFNNKCTKKLVLVIWENLNLYLKKKKKTENMKYCIKVRVPVI